MSSIWAADLRRRLLLATAFEAARLTGENGERRLEPVRERTGTVTGLADELFLPVEQPVEVVDHRLDLAWEAAVEARLHAVMNRPQLAVELAERVEALALIWNQAPTTSTRPRSARG